MKAKTIFLTIISSLLLISCSKSGVSETPSCDECGESIPPLS